MDKSAWGRADREDFGAWLDSGYHKNMITLLAERLTVLIVPWPQTSDEER